MASGFTSFCECGGVRLQNGPYSVELDLQGKVSVLEFIGEITRKRNLGSRLVLGRNCGWCWPPIHPPLSSIRIDQDSLPAMAPERTRSEERLLLELEIMVALVMEEVLTPKNEHCEMVGIKRNLLREKSSEWGFRKVEACSESYLNETLKFLCEEEFEVPEIDMNLKQEIVRKQERELVALSRTSPGVRGRSS